MWRKRLFLLAGEALRSIVYGAKINDLCFLSLFCFIRELGIGIVAYSPLGRGFLSSGPKLVENLQEGDFRKVCSLHYDV